jgi:copper chaperone NosL
VRRGPGLVAAAVLVASLGPGCVAPPGPVAIALSQDACASCRMLFTSTATAAQIVRGGEEPVLFDDLECLREYLERRPIEADASVYLMDHRTLEWVEARQAVVTRARQLDTPMGSGLLAHADAASRDADPAARGGVPVDRGGLLGSRPGDRP